MTSRTPIAARPDQRYWRRRANRRVRKARFAHNSLRWVLVVLVNGGIAAALLVVGARTFERIVHSEEFRLRHVEVEGNRRASAERIRANLQLYVGQNLLELRLPEVEGRAKGDPWVLQTSVKRVLPGTLRVSVRERTPAAAAVIGEIVHVVDDTGYVIGPSGPGMTDDLVVLTGLDGLDEPALIAALRAGVSYVHRLQQASPGFAANISELDLSRPGLVDVRLTTPGPRVRLDPERIERNVQHYLELRRGIESRVGPVEYVDLRWRDRISVMPAARSSVQRGR